MSTLAPAAVASPPAHARRPFLPLVRADLLKLRKNRSLFWTAAAMTIGPIVFAHDPGHPPRRPSGSSRTGDKQHTGT